MNATSTHDTKRSEDVRARINVLSELPDEWLRHLKRWTRWNSSQTAPDANEQILIYQTLLGAWPIEADRFKPYITKALREGRTHTNWMDVNKQYEDRVLSFVDSLYANHRFLDDLSRFYSRIAWFGYLSSLSQLVLKITSPGVPDFYRGSEVWDLSLTDPDNRRPVDYAGRIAVLNQLRRHANPADLLRNMPDGRIKMFVTWKALTFRRRHSELFLKGDYIPLKVYGEQQEHVLAYARHLKDQWSITVVPRLLARRGRTLPLGVKTWGDTAIEFPPGAPLHWVNVFTNEAHSGRLQASKLFEIFPLALL